MSQNSTRKKMEHQLVVPNQKKRRMTRTFFTNAQSQHDTPSKGSVARFTLLRLAQSVPSLLSSYV